MPHTVPNSPTKGVTLAVVARKLIRRSRRVLSAVAAEMNRHAYTGYGAAGMNWLETVWPGNDTVKVAFLEKLRETRAKSAFSEELRLLATDTR